MWLALLVPYSRANSPTSGLLSKPLNSHSYSTAFSAPSPSQLQVSRPVGDISVMAGDGSHCGIFSSGRFWDSPQGSQSAWSKLWRSLGGTAVWTSGCARGGTGQRCFSACCYHVTCLTLAVFSQMLKKIMRTFFLKINSYIFMFASWFLYLFLLSLCISKPFFRGAMSTNLQPKLWKWPWGLRTANSSVQKKSPPARLSEAARQRDLQISVV